MERNRVIIVIVLAILVVLGLLTSFCSNERKLSAQELLQNVEKEKQDFDQTGDPSSYLLAGRKVADKWDRYNILAGETINPVPVYVPLQDIVKATAGLKLSDSDQENLDQINQALSDWERNRPHPTFVP